MTDEPDREPYLIRVRLSAPEVERWIMLAEAYGFTGELPQGRLVKGSDAYNRAGLAAGLEQLLQEAAGGENVMQPMLEAPPWSPENDT